MLDLADLHGALIANGRFDDLAPGDLEPLETGGVAHDHIAVNRIRIDGKAFLVRAPRLSQWGLSPEENLDYQAAAFDRAAASGQTPVVFGVLPISQRLPMGALLVERIAGSKPDLPGDLAAIARCLARIHCLPVPPPDGRAPLRIHHDPVTETLKVIEEQAAYLPDADLMDAAKAALEEELTWARGFAGEAAGKPHLITLVGTDTHPGNFLITDTQQAVFVDLEKALYGAPAIDLAHASLYTSTMWDPDCATALEDSDVDDFYRTYFAASGADHADQVRPWIQPMRRLTWLRTVTWFVRWRVLSQRPDQSWSAARLPGALRRHVAKTVAHCTDPHVISSVRAEWL